MFSKIKCGFCSSQNKELIFDYFEPDKYEKNSFSKKKYYRAWFECLECKNFFSCNNNKVNEREFYEKVYRNKNTSFRENSTEENFKKIIKLNSSESECDQRILRIMNFKEKNDSPFKTALDIGGASGVFAYKLRKYFQKVTVLDLSEDGHFLNDYSIDYIQDSYNSVKKKYSFVSANYVMEHLSNPLDLVESMREMIFDDGLIYIEVPSSKSFTYLEKDHDTFNSTHKFIFNPERLNFFFKRKGLEIIFIEDGLSIRGYYYLGLYCKVYKLKK